MANQTNKILPLSAAVGAANGVIMALKQAITGADARTYAKHSDAIIDLYNAADAVLTAIDFEVDDKAVMARGRQYVKAMQHLADALLTDASSDELLALIDRIYTR